jgi:C1A family cysteine protease
VIHFFTPLEPSPKEHGINLQSYFLRGAVPYTMKKNFRIHIALTLLTLVCFTREANAAIERAPLSKAFLEYAEVGALKDYAPSPVDLSHLARADYSRYLKSAAGGESLPGKFDLRQLGYVTPAKDQKNLDNCWAYSALGSIESSHLRATGESLDLSETHLSWFAHHGASPFTGNYTDGGFDTKSVAVLARWVGPTLESAVPSGSTPTGLASDYANVLHLEDAFFLGLEFFSDSPDIYLKPDADARKLLIYEHGGISAGMFSPPIDERQRYYDSGSHAWYYNGPNSVPNHSVLLVGWDDDYPRTNFKSGVMPSKDGAWLIKNSWGRDFGDDGFFWMSYEDVSLSDGVAFLAGNVLEYDNNYGYDDLGWCMSSGAGAGYTAWMANVFRSGPSGETLKAVSFYTTSNNAAYDAYVYVGLPDASKPDSGTLSARFSGTLDFAGYHTVKLPTPATLPSGASFSVVIEMTTPGYSYPMAIETRVEKYSDKAIIEEGVSFISADGSSWSDLAADEANVCIKAFTSDGMGTRSENAGGCGTAGLCGFLPGLAVLCMIRRGSKS